MTNKNIDVPKIRGKNGRQVKGLHIEKTNNKTETKKSDQNAFSKVDGLVVSIGLFLSRFVRFHTMEYIKSH